jgi:hypothetical protein
VEECRRRLRRPEVDVAGGDGGDELEFVREVVGGVCWVEWVWDFA